MLGDEACAADKAADYGAFATFPFGAAAAPPPSTAAVSAGSSCSSKRRIETFAWGLHTLAIGIIVLTS
jgi:hypothetical protein